MAEPEEQEKTVPSQGELEKQKISGFIEGFDTLLDPLGCGSKPKVPFWGWESHPKVVFFRGFLGGHQGTGVLTHGHLSSHLVSFCFTKV